MNDLALRDPAFLSREATRLQSVGDIDAAMACWSELLAQVPQHVTAWVALGALQKIRRDFAAAAESFGRAVALNPYHGAAQFELGDALRESGRPGEAIGPLEKAVALMPADARVQGTLGIVLWLAGEQTRARAAYEAAVALDPNDPVTRFNLGLALQAVDRREEAVSQYRAALALNPADPVAIYSNLGTMLSLLDRTDEAIAAFEKQVELAPDDPSGHLNLGVLLAEQDEFDRAQTLFKRTIALAPHDPSGPLNQGVLLHRQGKLKQSIAAERKALALRPELDITRFTLGLTLLLAGQFEEGWDLSEARWALRPSESAAHRKAAPEWDGGALEPGQTLLIYAEQGYGDTLQFIRFAQILASRGIWMIIEVQKVLKSFIKGQVVSPIQGVVPVFGLGEKLPRFDAQIALLSIPRLLRTRLDTIPAEIPYFTTDPTRRAQWRSRMADLKGLRVGLVWNGEPRPDDPVARRQDRRRSLPLAMLAPLADIPGVDFVSLQLGTPAAQARAASGGLVLHDWTSEIHDFHDTAALICELDLVISVDTAVVHLAGALGRPVWLLNRFDTCWRWLLERDDSPWYPTLRQFRQTKIGDWASAVAPMRPALAALAAAR